MVKHEENHGIMSKDQNIERCIGCGKPLAEGQKVKVIFEGKTSKNEIVDNFKPFGKMHDECFTSAVDAPDAIMAEIRKAAKKKTKKVVA